MKILFLQNKGRSYGGVWQVNKMVGEALINDGYDVAVVSIRENHNDYVPTYDERMHVETLNTIDEWETYSWREIIKSFPTKGAIKKLNNRLHNIKTMSLDKKRLANFIRDYQPDYIVSSHYQMLDMIPSNYLSKTYHEQHQSFNEAMAHTATRKTLLKYKDKIKYIWLSKKAMEEAIKLGFKNSTYLYNAVRFETNKISDVIKNKKLVTIARISNEKRIDLMIDIANEVIKKHPDWVLEIYGDGESFDKIDSIVSEVNNKNIKLMGRTNNPMGVLLTSSINLNTSVCEGFALSILEANECGIPTISFNTWESVNEEIINGKTGFTVKDKEEFINKLDLLMSDNKLLKEMSTNSKKYNDNFKIGIIVKEWEKLFK